MFSETQSVEYILAFKFIAFEIILKHRNLLLLFTRIYLAFCGLSTSLPAERGQRTKFKKDSGVSIDSTFTSDLINVAAQSYPDKFK